MLECLANAQGIPQVQYIGIQYRIRLAPDTTEVFDLQLHPDSLAIVRHSNKEPPPWTALEYYQCPHCPLRHEVQPQCPVALNLVDIVEKFSRVASFDEVDVEIITSDRTTTKKTTAQKAIGSLFGLLMATSDCPHTAFLKPMARFHLPMSSQEETIYRVTGMYLLAQYFLRREGKTPDSELKGLHVLYENLHTVNVAIAQRLRHWTEEDSSVNAIVILDVFASILPFAIEDELQRIEKLFAPYLTDSYTENVSRRLDQLSVEGE